MPSYFCSLKEWTLAEWTATGSIIGKTTVDPEAPSEATLIKINTAAKKNEGKFNVPTLAGGEKVIAATIHVYAKVNAEGKSLKFGFVSPAVSSEPTVKVASAWFTVSLSKAQAEALTQENLAALTVLLENVLAKATSVYEVYLALETTTSGSPVNLSGTIAVNVGSSGTATDKVGLGGTVAVKTVATGAATDRLGLGGTVAVRFGSSGTLTTKSGAAVNLAGTISVVTAAQAKAGAKLGLGGTIKVTSSTQAKAGLRQSLGGAIHLTTTAVATPRLKMSLGGAIQVVVGATGTVTIASGARSALIVYTTIVQAPRVPLTVTQSGPIPLSVDKPKAISLTTQIE